ncbi:thiolase domain-containing protein [Mycobacterium sp. MUNTM1]
MTSTRVFIAGAYEHPARVLPDTSLSQIHAEVALGALADAGLTLADVDGYLCGTNAPGFGALSMVDYLGLNPSYVDTTETGGSSYMVYLGHAASAIAAGKCDVALITLAGRPRQIAEGGFRFWPDAPEYSFEDIYGTPNVVSYALAAKRHMYEFGTTNEQLAMVKVTASQHAKHNPHAFLRNETTVDQVLASPMVSDPLHRDDCCVITDGGGALVVVSAAVAKELPRHCIRIMGQGEAIKHPCGGAVDLTYSGAVWSGARAYAEAGVTAADIDYASIYDSFTITVVETIEDLGFCAKGDGGPFVGSGALRAPDGAIPFNTDGGGLCNNHPGNRGGMTKIIEAVRQLRNEAHPAVQVRDCEIALAHGTGGLLGSRMGSATVILGREDA